MATNRGDDHVHEEVGPADARVRSILTWARENGYSVGALTIGDVSIALADLRISAPRSPHEKAAPAEAPETDIYDEYGHGDPEWEKLRGPRKG